MPPALCRACGISGSPRGLWRRVPTPPGVDSSHHPAALPDDP